MMSQQNVCIEASKWREHLFSWLVIITKAEMAVITSTQKIHLIDLHIS